MRAFFGKIMAFGIAVFIAVGAACFAESPAWATFNSSIPAVVLSSDFDSGLVLMDGGADRGFREGAACEIFRSEDKIGELMVVLSSAEKCVGALLGEADAKTGDVVRLKIAR